MEIETQEMNLPPEYAAGLAAEQELAYSRFLKAAGVFDTPEVHEAFITEWCGAFGWGNDAEHHYG